jgi:hypothetical protein
MSRFSNALEQALSATGWNASRYAEAGNLHKSRVSRWLSGAIAPEPDSLREIIAPFPDQIKAGLLVAYTRDITERAAPGLVDVSAISSIVSKPVADYLATPKPPEGLSNELLSQVYRVAELARDVPEIAAIFAEFDRLIQRRAINP